MPNDYSQTVTREESGLVAKASGGRFPIWSSSGLAADDGQIASVATAQTFTGINGAAYRFSAADGTNAASIASGTPENVYVRFNGTGADGTGQDWLWRCANGYDFEVRMDGFTTLSFKAVNGGAVKLFYRRLW